MKRRYFENGLALLGALVIIAGVSAAATDALAANLDSVEVHGSTLSM